MRLETCNRKPDKWLTVQFFNVIFVVLLWASFAFSAEVKDFSSCLSCHEGIEKLDKNHDFSCEKCHVFQKNRSKPLYSHSLIIRYPGAPDNAETFCGPCHQDEISNLKNSLHYTMAGIINQTRYLWGAQPDPFPEYSAIDHQTLKKLPPNPKSVDGPADLVDDLLRRRCLSCHPGVVPPGKRGFYRGLGCGACHLLYEDDGVYRGGDRTIKGKKGYSKTHTFCKAIPVRQCLHCHNGPRVGADYTGLFEHDYHESYRTPIKNGMLPEQVYLMDHHKLKADFHYEKGILCIDCHGKGDVMGRGPVYSHQQESVSVRCRHCHGPFDGDGKNSRHPGVVGDNFISRSGIRYPIPAWKESIKAHAIPQMKNVHCTGCHSRWSFSDYGPSLLRDDREDLSRWSLWRLQGDALVAECFDNSGRFLGQVPEPGPWFLGWRFRRWEYLTLGKDSKGRIVPYRPRYQYLVSFVDKNGKVILDNVTPNRGDGSGPGWAYMPFYPHTIQKKGRNCEACHGQPLAAGQGLWEGLGPDLLLTLPSPPVYSSLRLLNENEKKNILTQTPAYRKWRFQVLWHDFISNDSPDAMD